MGYEPFLIAPFQTGLDIDQEIWQLPRDAFSEIVNGHIKHGMIEKRNGTSFVGYMAHNPTFAITGASQANPTVITAVGHTYVNGNQVIITNITGMTELNNRVFTVANAGVNTFELSGENSTNYTAYGAGGRVALFDGGRIMGIHEYVDASGVRETLMFDTKRAAIFDGTNYRFNPLDPADIFSDSDTAYVLGAGWQSTDGNSRFYFTNGKPFAAGLDGIRYYDEIASSTTTTSFTPTIETTKPTTLYGAKFIFSIKQRLLLLYTYEFDAAITTAYPQRIRWCAAQNPSNWDQSVAGGGGYLDIPTNQQIVTAYMLQDSIVVFMTNSVWVIRPVSDPALPFRVDQINDFRAADSRTGAVGFDRNVFALGVRGLVASDGVQTKRVDERIQDFIIENINIDQFTKVFGKRDFAETRTWILYPQTESTDSNAALIYDEESKAFSTYLFEREAAGAAADMNVLGYLSASFDLAAEDFIAANGKDWAAIDAPETDTAWSYFFSKNDQLFVGGDRSGSCFTMNDGVTDYGAPIVFTLGSAGWNPYIDQGAESQFGYMDLYLSTDIETILTIEFFKNDDDTPYRTQKLNLLPNILPFGQVNDVTIKSDPTTGFVVDIANHGKAAGDIFYLYGVQGPNFLNNRQFTIASVTADTISVSEDISGFGVAITSISNANPGVVIAPDHGFVNGDIVYIVNVTGMTEVNDIGFTVANATLDTFELQGVDTTAYGAYGGGGYLFHDYISGGIGTEKRFYKRNVWKRAYAGGIGTIHKIRITESGTNSSWKILAFRPWFRKRGNRTHG